MTDQLEQLQANIVNAVQEELTRYSQEVAGEFSRLREELASGVAARNELESQVRALATAVEQSSGTGPQLRHEIQQALESRLNEFSQESRRRHDELNERLGRVVDEANVGIASAVEAAARPLLKEMEHRQDKTDADVQRLDTNLHKFDEQAGRMVTHINQVTAAVEARLDQVTRDVNSTFEERVAALVMRLDEVSAVMARQQSEVNNIVGQRVDASEDRINERIISLESRLSEDLGERVAEIDAHVGRVATGLDEAVIMLNDRIAAADSNFVAVEQEFARIRQELADVDAEAIDEIKDQVQSALGQAELVRIEVERFQETVGEKLEKSSLRITELETVVQEQHLDVETSIQLERLEEVERAVLMLDPDQFVRKSDFDGDLPIRQASSGPSSNDGAMSAEDAADLLERISAPASAPLAPPSVDNPSGPDFQPPVTS